MPPVRTALLSAPELSHRITPIKTYSDCEVGTRNTCRKSKKFKSLLSIMFDKVELHAGDLDFRADILATMPRASNNMSGDCFS